MWPPRAVRELDAGQRRLLVFVALQAAAVGLLASVAGELSHAFLVGPPAGGLRTEVTGAAVVWTARLVQALWWVGVALFVLGPPAVASALVARGDADGAAPLAWAVAAVVGLPLLGVGVSVGLSSPGSPRGLAALAVVAVAVALATHVAGDGFDGIRPPSPPLALALLVGSVLVVAAVGGAGVVAEPAGGLVVDERVWTPAVDWNVTFEPAEDGRGVLTVTHDGGDRVDADRVTVRGSGFAAVAGAEQTGPGPWSGERSGETVEAGDSTTVGVTADCEMRFVYEAELYEGTMGRYDCPGGGG